MRKNSGATLAVTDEELVFLAAQGSGEAFTQLINRFMPKMKRLAERYQNLPGLGPDDLTQEGLIGLLSAVRAYRAEHGGFAAFATTCIRNRMLSAVRRSLPAGEFELTDAEETLSDLPAGQADPVELLVEREEAARLYERLEKLLTPLEYRVLTAYLSGQSYKEMAACLAVSVKAVDNALGRVRQKLAGDFPSSYFQQ